MKENTKTSLFTPDEDELVCEENEPVTDENAQPGNKPQKNSRSRDDRGHGAPWYLMAAFFLPMMFSIP